MSDRDATPESSDGEGHTDANGPSSGTGTVDSAGGGEPDVHGELGLDANVAAALAYISPPLSGIVLLLIEEESEFVRFHAIQSIVYLGVAGGIWGVLFLLGMVVSLVTFGIATLVVVPVLILLFFPLLGYHLLLMYKAYQGERYEVPGIWPWADQFL